MLLHLVIFAFKSNPMKAKVAILIYFMVSFSLSAQEIKGKVIDAETGITVPYAKVGFPSINVYTSTDSTGAFYRSEEHTSELQSRPHLVCRLLLEKKKKK